MSLFAQHGHGKGDKLPIALREGSLDGVVFGARNETPERLHNCVEELRADFPDAELLFDPQFYVSTLSPPNNRFLEEYPYYTQGLTAADFTGSRRLRAFAQSTLDFQQSYGFTTLLSPTVFFDSFSDRWHQTALNLADAALEHWATLSSPSPLLLSFALTETALDNRGEIDRFLDTITQESWSMTGLYLIVVRQEDGYNQRFDPVRLANYLYLVHALGTINDLRVVCGYADLIGIPLRAVGANAIATGWTQTLRRLQRKAFIKQKGGGQQPRERYTSSKLFNSIFLTELEQIHTVDLLGEVLSGVPLDQLIEAAASPEAAAWSTSISQQHHWQTLSALNGTLVGSPRQQVQRLLRQLRHAENLYRRLDAVGVQFERHTGPDHLGDWIEGLNQFCRLVGYADR